MNGRATGTEGGRQAQQYVAQEFSRIGLSMLGSSKMDDLKTTCDGSGYYHPFSVFSHFTEAPHSTVTWPNQPRRLVWQRDYRADMLSASSSVAAQAVYVKNGYVATDGSHDDYAGIDVTDKIVVISDGVPNADALASSRSRLPLKIVQAAMRKAKGILFVVDDSQWKPDIATGDQVTMSLPVMRIKRSAAQPLLDALQKGISPLVSMSITLKAVNTGASNVAGWLEGTGPKLAERPILVGAHADHLGMIGDTLYPGADDNASGSAVMLALASALKDHPLRRPVLFVAFMGEEKGILGSNAFIKHPAWPLEQIEAVVNLDMVGRLRDDKLWAMCVGSDKRWSEMLDDTNKKALIPFQLAKEDGYSGVSDFAAFMNACVPCMFFFTGLHEDYHKPTDTVDRLNTWGQKRVALFAEQILRALDASDEKPEFVVKGK
ncbi:MAG: M20/M25/M40 family metallo-hydrolase [Armatimonadota bacterium]